jgi:Ni/Fe-hydrogenase subunit HybB-like protein
MNVQAQTAAPLNNAVLGASVVAVIVSLVLALGALMEQGHAAFNTQSDGVVWGLPVATYVFFVLTSTGLTFVASLAMVFGIDAFYPIAKRCVWMAVATLVAGFVALALELGHPFRMLWAIPTSFQVTSPMNWMGLFYALYLVFLLLKFRKLEAGDWDSAASRRLGIACLVAVIVAHGTLGLVFGMMAMRPFWYDGMLPLYFLATAALSGIAFAVLITGLAHGFEARRMGSALRALMADRVPRIFAAVLAVVLLFMLARTITGLWSNAEGLQAYHWMIASPWFWIEAIGLITAFVLLLSPARAQLRTQLAAAALVMGAVFIGRYEFVIGGQVVPVFKGAWAPTFAAYTPSATEWMLTLLALSLAFAIYAAGERLFDLSAAPRRIRTL